MMRGYFADIVISTKILDKYLFNWYGNTDFQFEKYLIILKHAN